MEIVRLIGYNGGPNIRLAEFKCEFCGNNAIEEIPVKPDGSVTPDDIDDWVCEECNKSTNANTK